MQKTLSNAKVLSICLLAMLWTAETSRLPSLHDITTGVCSLISSSLNGLQKRHRFYFISFLSFGTVLNKLNDRVSDELERVKLTCTVRGPAHWRLCPYHTCCDCWNSNPQIADLAPAYRWSAASATATTVSFRLLPFSAAPPLPFHLLNRFGESRSVKHFSQPPFTACDFRCDPRDGRVKVWEWSCEEKNEMCGSWRKNNPLRSWNRNLQCAGLLVCSVSNGTSREKSWSQRLFTLHTTQPMPFKIFLTIFNA